VSWEIHNADCLDFCRAQPDNAFALTFGSESQVELTKRRVANVQRELIA
jgi:hypothetical protein